MPCVHVSQTFLYIWIKKKIPLSKSRGPKAFNNYRPIAISLILSKIIERIVYRQIIYKYAQEHQLVTSEQLGFRPYLSKSRGLTQVTKEILLNINNRLITCAVFIDLRKPFEQLITPF